jgi:hypothetical protein
MRFFALLIAAALMAAPAAAKAPRHASGHAHRHAAPAIPVVIELYTAQGCADCPAANDMMLKLAEEPGVIALTFPVDYWDYLGWRDTFAKPEFSDRQHAFMKSMKLRDVYTPQVVVDGRAQMSGLKPDDVDAAVHDAQKDPMAGPDIAPLGRSQVEVGSGRVPAGGAFVWLVRYAPEVRDVTVTRGENKGRIIRQGDVVRDLVKLGPWRGASKALRLPKASDPALRTVVLVQAARTGRILAARRL